MTVTQDLSILSLVTNASLLVQAVMALLFVVSLMSWSYIFRKWFTLRRAKAQTEKFERDFWSGADLNALYQSAANDRHGAGSLERAQPHLAAALLAARRAREGDTVPTSPLRIGRPVSPRAARSRARPVRATLLGIREAPPGFLLA